MDQIAHYRITLSLFLLLPILWDEMRFKSMRNWNLTHFQIISLCTRPRFDSEAQGNSKLVTVWQLLVYKCTCPLLTNAPELATSCTLWSWSVFIRLFLSVLVNDFYSCSFIFVDGWTLSMTELCLLLFHCFVFQCLQSSGSCESQTPAVQSSAARQSPL